jgi:hypothetical protein
MQETDAAVEVWNKHLAWLVQAEPDRLAAVQAQIREKLIEMLDQQS